MECTSGQNPNPRVTCARPWRWRFWLGWILSLAAAVWLLQRVAWTELTTALVGVSMGGVGCALVSVWTSIPLRALQWALLLERQHRAPFAVVVRALAWGYVDNALLPVKGGEFLKVVNLRSATGMPLARIVASLFLVRVLDLVPLCGLVGAAAVLTVSSANLDVMRGATYFAVATGATIASIGGLGLLSRRYAWSLEDRLPSRCRAWAMDAYHALAIVGKPYQGGPALGLSVLCWTLFTLGPVPLFVGLGMSASKALGASVVVTGVTTMAHVLPSAPAALGTFHALFVAALTWYAPEVDASRALAYATVLHAIGMLGPAIPSAAILSVGWGTCVPSTIVRTGDDCE